MKLHLIYSKFYGNKVRENKYLSSELNMIQFKKCMSCLMLLELSQWVRFKTVEIEGIIKNKE